MITAVDTNILLDVFTKDAAFIAESGRLLKQAIQDGAIISSDIVYAELVPQFSSQDELNATLKTLGLSIVVSNIDSAFQAGLRYFHYRQSGGARTRLLADFIIGAHAITFADRLLTRDRGFYKTYFSDIVIMR